MDRKYTALEMRKVAKSFFCNEVCLDFDKRDIAAMLRQAADMIDCISKEIERIDSMPSAPLDGALIHQEINGHRLKARIEFFDSVKMIIRNEKKKVE